MRPADYVPRLFQTYPRGVEVIIGLFVRICTERFRRTLVGLKSVVLEEPAEVFERFRRTLVGLKWSMRRETRKWRAVSDVPSWG